MTAPLSVAAMGSVIRAHRKASGLSQKDLAKAAGVSRATLNYLESGREDMEIGASKLLALLEVLGIPVGVPADVSRDADEATVQEALASLGKGRKLAEGDLMEALASGRIPPKSEAGLAAFLEHAPDGAAPRRSGSRPPDRAIPPRRSAATEGPWPSPSTSPAPSGWVAPRTL